MSALIYPISKAFRLSLDTHFILGWATGKRLLFWKRGEMGRQRLLIS